MSQMHEVDYEIFGDDMQFVEVELDPQEAAIAEAGGMMYMYLPSAEMSPAFRLELLGAPPGFE